MADIHSDQKPLTDRTSHANVRKGLTDYNDGNNSTTHLGNDAYTHGANLPPDDLGDVSRLDGRVAEGNQMMEHDEEEFFNPNPEVGLEDEGIDYE